MIKIPIAKLEDLEKVRTHLDSCGFIGREIMFHPHTEDYGLMLLRNGDYISGRLNMATHAVDEDLEITPGRLLKFNQHQLRTILDMDNFKDE